MLDYKINEDISLKLKDYQDSHELFKLIKSSREHLKEWMVWVDSVQTEEDVVKSIHKNLIEFADQKGVHFLILYKGAIAGTIGLKYIDWSIKSAEIGYWLGKDYLGKGIMIEACRVVMDYGFQQLKLNKIEIWAAEDNQKSRQIPVKLGFTYEGMRRADEILNGKYVDMCIYGMLAKEWAQLK